MSQLKKILVSLPDSLLEQVNDYAQSSGINRSELVREAMKEYIANRKKSEMRERLKKGYEMMSAINLEWAEACMNADTQVQFEYEEKLSESE